MASTGLLPLARCTDLSSLGGNTQGFQTGPLLGGSILKVSNINSTLNCFNYCNNISTLATYPNITYSSELQAGGQLECACFMNLNLTTVLSLPNSTSGCQPCQKLPEPIGVPTPDLGTCGVENASNGFVSLAYLSPIWNPCKDISMIGGLGTGFQADPGAGGNLLKVNQQGLNSTGSCQAYCSSPAVLGVYPNITFSSEVQVGGLLQCVCVMGVTNRTVADWVGSSACQACQMFPPATPAPSLGVCGVENASNGFINALYLTPVQNPCVDISSLGGLNGYASFQLSPSKGGGILKVAGINNTQSCNKYCSSILTSPPVTFSSELQVGGQVECACLVLNATVAAGLPVSTSCSPCQVYGPGGPVGGLGVCGQENASNGYVSSVWLTPVNQNYSALSSSSSSTGYSTTSVPTSSSVASSSTRYSTSSSSSSSLLSTGYSTSASSSSSASLSSGYSTLVSSSSSVGYTSSSSASSSSSSAASSSPSSSTYGSKSSSSAASSSSPSSSSSSASSSQAYSTSTSVSTVYSTSTSVSTVLSTSTSVTVTYSTSTATSSTTTVYSATSTSSATSSSTSSKATTTQSASTGSTSPPSSTSSKSPLASSSSTTSSSSSSSSSVSSSSAAPTNNQSQPSSAAAAATTSTTVKSTSTGGPASNIGNGGSGAVMAKPEIVSVAAVTLTVVAMLFMQI